MARAQEIRVAPTFKDLAEEYLDRRRNKKIIEENERMLRKDIIHNLGDILAGEVSKRDIFELVDRIKDRDSPVMVCGAVQLGQC